uniref:Uncharacterized protein n=1 Tax=Rhabditophanes sp. KR3021 TaxID=114890 RepID=A0AC35TR29_9BILA
MFIHKLIAVSIIFIQFVAKDCSAQLAAVYDGATRSKDCASWSSFGPCIWPNKDTRVSYIKQLKPICQQHWFYKFISDKYAPALDSFFEYFNDIIEDNKPCGLCSYKQSCGYGGKRSCNLSPFSVKGGRSLMPFYVAENVCSSKDLMGDNQKDSCTVSYAKTLQNGQPCQLWPTKKVDLSSIEPAFQESVQKLQWYSCLVQSVKDTNRPKPVVNKVCRCCCFPYRPNPISFKCEKMKGMPDAPGAEFL